jgi:hypothetical protein
LFGGAMTDQPLAAMMVPMTEFMRDGEPLPDAAGPVVDRDDRSVAQTDDPRIANAKTTIAHRRANGTGNDLDINLAWFGDAEVM